MERDVTIPRILDLQTETRRVMLNTKIPGKLGETCFTGTF